MPAVRPTITARRSTARRDTARRTITTAGSQRARPDFGRRLGSLEGATPTVSHPSEHQGEAKLWSLPMIARPSASPARGKTHVRAYLIALRERELAAGTS